jgi:putative flavoprotein involved in K+ transport
MAEHVEVVVIGGGQAGLSMSYYLTQLGIPHVVLERRKVAESWRNRWDSFTMNTPNWMLRLPGAPYQGADPDGFQTRAQIVLRLDQYARCFQAPLRCGIEAVKIEQRQEDGRYLVETTEACIEASSIVVATGGFPEPKLPAVSAALPADLLQLHSSAYRCPDQLPAGAVLAVGTGSSGCQIAEDLHRAGRQVYLAVGSCGWFPRHYRGKDTMWWLNQMGLYGRTVDQLPSPEARFACYPYATGPYAHHNINLRRWRREGMVLLGHLQAVQGTRVVVAPDLEASLTKADAFAAQMMQDIDAYILRTGSASTEPPGHQQPMFEERATSEPIESLDLRSAGIRTVIWGTGYRYNFGWVRVPVFDQTGFPLHQRGVTAAPGLYFLGLPWLHTRKSGLLFGVGEDAAFLASTIATRQAKAA